MRISYFLVSICFFLFPILVTAESSSSSEQEVYSFERMITARNPEKIPPAIPNYFVPEGSTYHLSTDLRSNFYSSIEAFLLYHNHKSKKETEDFYMKSFQGKEWRLLQSDTSNERTLYLAEGFSRKVITIVIRESNTGGSVVRIFFKKNSNY